MENRQDLTAVEIERFKLAPEEMLDYSITQLHSIPGKAVEEIRLEGLRHRFQYMVAHVPALTLLAEEQGITEISRVEDAAPLLFPHSVYKSYPLSILERGRFDQLTRWFDTLTTVDLSDIDASNCAGIDDWLDLLEAKTELRVKHSSGTTGKLSFIPANLSDHHSSAKAFKLLYQGFGEEPNADLGDFDSLPIILVANRRGSMTLSRLMDAVVEFRRGGDESSVIASNPGRLSADALSIGGRIQAAQAKGELGQLQLSPAILARREALLKEHAEQPERLRAFFADVSARFRGERIILLTIPPFLYDLAVEGQKSGVSGLFAPDSLITLGGGLKGRVFPDNYREVICDFLGIPSYPKAGYGMTEMTGGGFRACPNDNFHVRPTIVPYLLDPQTGAQLPRTGTHTGRFGFVDLVAKGHWGGFLTGDEVTMTWDADCGCGRVGCFIHPAVRRFSEKEGGDDKVTCAGAPEAHDKAMEFLASAAI